MELSDEIQQAYLSHYLLYGWKEESFELEKVDVEPGRINGLLKVKRYFTPDDGVFHLSAQAAMVWIFQLGIIYGCWENALPAKIGEVYLRDIELRFGSVINKTEGIRISMFFPEKAKRTLPRGAVYYKDVGIDVEEGAFTGRLSYILPLPD